jgi:hypothetical protein
MEHILRNVLLGDFVVGTLLRTYTTKIAASLGNVILWDHDHICHHSQKCHYAVCEYVVFYSVLKASQAY